ncbi:AbrB/MazE/SpoVT family DNA-binding domain-containing protein [Candidatus Woesearchaeota archaeon]|nr:AbrB/MazE/SpoVT family DNA-binding domain-containing protein [Candidatus Woesearchaeota archaeon]
MAAIESKLRKWGRSIGLVIPKEAVIKDKLKEGDNVSIIIRKNQKNLLKETFGIFKFKRSIKEILAEGNRESWDE